MTITIFKLVVFRLGMILCCVSLVAITTVSCKKEIKLPPSPKPPSQEDRTDSQKLIDSIYYYYKLYSLWTDDIKTYDPISDYTDQLPWSNPSAETVLSDLKRQTPFLQAYKGPIDRFSYIEHFGYGRSGSARADIVDGYGLYVSLIEDDDKIRCYANFIEGGSPADRAGMRRGDELLSINGNVLADILNSTDSPEVKRRRVEDLLNRRPTLVVEVLRSDDLSNLLFTLQYGSYAINPITKDAIYDLDGKKIAYLALSSFEELYDHNTGAETPFKQELLALFEKFAAEGVTELILDLRYNTGGYVSSSIYLNNLIINRSHVGKVMFKYGVNENLTNDRQFRDVLFTKLPYNEATRRQEAIPSLDLQNIYFLVTEATASAAEIILSALCDPRDMGRGHFPNAQIIAEGTHTYGKPVGFFRQDIMDRVGLWAASFRIINAQGYTDYYEGIPATQENVDNDVTVDFGDRRDPMVARAIQVATGSSAVGPSSGEASARVGRAFGQKREKLDVNLPRQRPLLLK